MNNSPKMFLQKIWDLYKSAALVASVAEQHWDKCVIRGRNHCVASKVEDMFAELLVLNVGKGARDVVALVDYPVYAGILCGKRRKIIYPDVMLCIRRGEKRLQVVHMYELKMNVGWMREDPAECFNKMQDLWEKMSQYASVKIDGAHYKLMFSDNVKYDLVIVSSVCNDQGRAFSHVEEMRTRGEGRLGGWMLSDCELNPKYAKDSINCREYLEPNADFSEMLNGLAKEVAGYLK